MIAWGEPLFRYCERGDHAGLWAEPANALSNVAFIIVALLAGIRLGRASSTARIGDGDFAIVTLLIAATTMVGIGSIMFHTVATRLGQLADIIPIGMFMLLYLAFALRVMLRASLAGVMLGLVLFVAGFVVLNQLPCQPVGSHLFAARALPRWCLNGGIAYLPALAGLLAVGASLHVRQDASARTLLAAAGLFSFSLALRSIDLTLCPLIRIGPVTIGAHALWHLGTAIVIHLLLKTAVDAVASRHDQR